MKLQEAKREAMLVEWREMVYNCRSSGQTVSAWCQSQGIPTTTYYRRQKQVWEQESQGLPEKVNDVQALQPVGSMALGVSFEALPSQYVSRSEEAEAKGQIILRKGEWTVEIRNGTEAELLSRILEVLQ